MVPCDDPKARYRCEYSAFRSLLGAQFESAGIQESMSEGKRKGVNTGIVNFNEACKPIQCRQAGPYWGKPPRGHVGLFTACAPPERVVALHCPPESLNPDCKDPSKRDAHDRTHWAHWCNKEGGTCLPVCTDKARWGKKFRSNNCAREWKPDGHGDDEDKDGNSPDFTCAQLKVDPSSQIGQRYDMSPHVCRTRACLGAGEVSEGNPAGGPIC